MSVVQAGQQAPDFTLTSLDGASISLAGALAKGPVVAAFFKISCPTCQFALPFLERLERAYAAGATFLGISQDDAEITREFCAEYGLNLFCVTDDDGYPVSNTYGITIVPTIYLLEPSGKVLLFTAGFDKDSFLRMSSELAVLLKLPEPVLFRPDEIIPDYKPG